MIEESAIKRVSREFLRLLIQLSLTNTVKFMVTKRCVMSNAREKRKYADKKVHEAIHAFICLEAKKNKQI